MRGTHGGAVLGPGHQVLLATVGEDVHETLYLSRLFLTDGDRLIAPGEHLVAPAGQPTDLARQLGKEVGHEPCELFAVGGPLPR